MVNPQRSKGTAFETKVVRFLNGAGFAARRVVQHGSNDHGDIHIGDVPDVVIEAKNHRRFDFGGWLRQAEREAANANKKVGIVVAKRPGIADPADSYVVMTLSALTHLLEGMRDQSSHKEGDER